MTIFTDDFNRADVPDGLGNGWLKGYGGTSFVVQLAGNQVIQLTGTGAIMVGLRPENYSANHYAQIRIAALPAAGNTWVPGPAVNAGSDGYNHCSISMRNTGEVRLVQRNAVVATFTATMAVGDVFRLEIAGGVVTAKQNGVVIGTWTDPAPVSTRVRTGLWTNSLISGGDVWAIDDFEAGDLAAAPAQLAGDAKAQATAGAALSAVGAPAQLVADAKTKSAATAALSAGSAKLAAAALARAQASAILTTASYAKVSLNLWKNNTGTIEANQTDLTMLLISVASGQVVVGLEGQSTDGSGAWTYTGPELGIGQAYMAVAYRGEETGAAFVTGVAP